MHGINGRGQELGSAQATGMSIQALALPRTALLAPHSSSMHDADAEYVASAVKQTKTGLPHPYHLRARRLNACLIWTSSSVAYKANVQGAERPAGLRAASTINQQPHPCPAHLYF